MTVLNCVRLLTRVLPYIFEDPEWKGFFWSALPSQSEDEDESLPLAQSLMNGICVSFYFILIPIYQIRTSFLIQLHLEGPD